MTASMRYNDIHDRTSPPAHLILLVQRQRIQVSPFAILPLNLLDDGHQVSHILYVSAHETLSRRVGCVHIHLHPWSTALLARSCAEATAVFYCQPSSSLRVTCPPTCIALRIRYTRSYDALASNRCSASIVVSFSSGRRSSTLHTIQLACSITAQTPNSKKACCSLQAQLSPSGILAVLGGNGRDELPQPGARDDEIGKMRIGHDGDGGVACRVVLRRLALRRWEIQRSSGRNWETNFSIT